jgi:hypothetical protein
MNFSLLAYFKKHPLKRNRKKIVSKIVDAFVLGPFLVFPPCSLQAVDSLCPATKTPCHP